MGEIVTNLFFSGKKKKWNAFVWEGSQNIFGTDWIEAFHLFNISKTRLVII